MATSILRKLGFNKVKEDESPAEPIIEEQAPPKDIKTIIAEKAAETKAVMERHPAPDDSAFVDANFTRDWFLARAAWNCFLDKEDIRQYMEIGSFEGRSALYAARLFPNATLTCIDTFEGGGAQHEHLRELFENLDQRFLRNIAPIRERVNVLKGTSTKKLAELSDESGLFDLIYVDGCHYYRNVMLDALLSWPLLKVGGIMIWDDYDFQMGQYGRRVPGLAAEQFLQAYEGDYEILFVTNQVAVRKIKTEPEAE